jgi:hypothetical protein
MKRTFLCLLFILFVSVGVPLAEENPPPAPDPAEVTPDPWPKVSQVEGVKYVIYQPQLDSWDGYLFKAQSAVSVQPAGTKEPVFGVLHFSAKTQVDRVARTVFLNDFTIQDLVMPSAPGNPATYKKGFLSMPPLRRSTMSLDRLEAMLAIEDAEQLARKTPVRNDPPRFVFSSDPALLIPIDGEPAWRPVQGTSLERAINTRVFLLQDKATGIFYIRLFDGFISSTALAGPWAAAQNVPASLGKTFTQLVQQRIVDPMEGQADETTNKKPSLKNGVPRIVVTTVPTELIVTEGEPQWLPIDNTMLLYVKNTTGNVFKNLNDQQIYVLVTGRWFRAPDLAGSWQYVEGKNLPPDFARIPDDSPKENVKASVPGTMQAQEAVIATAVPQTATVDREKAAFTPEFNGVPELKPVQDTTLMYVVNSPYPIIMVSANEWYAVQNGIWYTANSAQGPWFVATSIPAVIYSIPPSSPLHYVTYVKIYDVTPRYVVVGYTPGYMGTVVTSDNVVVYGTGYVYPPYIYSSYWYPYPVTYGYAASITYTPWTGWFIGFGFGWSMWGGYACAPAPYWGAMPYARYSAVYPRTGVAVWGPSGWAVTTSNVYTRYATSGVVTRSAGGYNAWTGRSWSNRVGASYNSTTGRISAGQRASVSNVYTGNYASGQRGATYNPNSGASARGGSVTRGNARTGAQNTVRAGNDVYAGKDGNAYRYNSQTRTAQRYSNGSWINVDKSGTASGAGARQTNTTQSLQAQQAARQKGDARSAASSWGSNSWGGGFNRSVSGSAGARTSAGSGAAARSYGGQAGGRSYTGSGGSGWSGGGGGFSGVGRSWGGGEFGGGRSFGGGGGGFSGGGRGGVRR